MTLPAGLLPCPDCEDGVIRLDDGSSRTCPACDGRGEVEDDADDPIGPWPPEPAFVEQPEGRS